MLKLFKIFGYEEMSMVENGRCRKSKTADVKTADVVKNGRCRAKTADVGVKTADVWVKAADVRTKTADV